MRRAHLSCTIGVEDVADGYRAMDRREAVKVLVRP
jgi:hypothetical protein